MFPTIVNNVHRKFVNIEILIFYEHKIFFCDHFSKNFQIDQQKQYKIFL